MLGAFVVLAAAVILARTLGTNHAVSQPSALAPKRYSPQLAMAIDYADRLFAEKKWLSAEKAYVAVLKLDHKNLTAYSHLGIIYSTQKNLSEAIECFQIAVRLKPSASTYQNLGLAYYENRNYIKAISAYEKAIMFEPSAPRYIGLSKSYRKVANIEQVIASLKEAVALDSSSRIRDLLIGALLENGQVEAARELEHPAVENQTAKLAIAGARTPEP